MGEEKLDVRRLHDPRPARPRRPGALEAATAPPRPGRPRERAQLERRFEAEWWMPAVPAARRLARRPGQREAQQRHWIGATPMEAELVRGGRMVPGPRHLPHGEAALALRETPCYTGDFGLFHTGASRAATRCRRARRARRSSRSTRRSWPLARATTAAWARISRAATRRATAACSCPQPDEQPGAMPEIAPSPDYERSIDQPFDDRAMVLQAWGAYGTAWPVVRQQLGVRPDLGRGRLEVVPQLPAGQSRVAGSNIRLGMAGSADVSARVSGSRHVTEVRARVALRRLVIGHTLAPGAERRAASSSTAIRSLPRARDEPRAGGARAGTCTRRARAGRARALIARRVAAGPVWRRGWKGLCSRGAVLLCLPIRYVIQDPTPELDPGSPSPA